MISHQFFLQSIKNYYFRICFYNEIITINKWLLIL
jgi:hypothetical protein